MDLDPSFDQIYLSVSEKKEDNFLPSNGLFGGFQASFSRLFKNGFIWKLDIDELWRERNNFWVEIYFEVWLAVLPQKTLYSLKSKIN